MCPFFGADAGLPFGAPAPISAGGVDVCATIVVDGVVSGTFDTTTGALTASIPLTVKIALGIDIDFPCPACVTADGVPNLGEAGTCSGGPRSGLRARSAVSPIPPSASPPAPATIARRTPAR